MTLLGVAGFVLSSASSLVTAPSAEAQGRTTGRLELPREKGLCPYRWNRETDTFCVPSLAANPTPAVYVRQNKSIPCQQGYFVDTDNDLVCTSYDRMTARSADISGGIARAGILNRCPTGWRASTNNKQCFTEIKNAPIPRLNNGKPCAPGELNDWGIWCTSNYEHLSYAEVDLAATRDFNDIYANAMNDGLDYNSIPSGLSPAARAFFKGANKSSGASAAGSQASTETTQANSCKTDTETASAVGGAVGGAVAGSKGAEIGSTLGKLGGLGKKKKKKKDGC
ncbi:hypothetical protein LPB140_06930 [Sphingorhabdus lutea]|uniref:Uncharacterized protein n=2 Tax=Sphingorhabdus lutea TaxID=1913578 RepID=A0A1L3JBQ5_9SPHN|nr:hypothetical protein LPB140_06930 [Sphingorhabdus lutea]